MHNGARMDERDPWTSGDLDPRVALAVERTLLAWLRTGIALMALGFVIARFGAFLRELPLDGAASTMPTNAPTIGFAVVAIGALVNLWASLRHRTIISRFRRGDTSVGLRGPVAIGVATAIGGLVLLLALRDTVFP